jgi:hypothetical protein
MVAISVVRGEGGSWESHLLLGVVMGGGGGEIGCESSVSCDAFEFLFLCIVIPVFHSFKKSNKIDHSKNNQPTNQPTNQLTNQPTGGLPALPCQPKKEGQSVGRIRAASGCCRISRLHLKGKKV